MLNRTLPYSPDVASKKSGQYLQKHAHQSSVESFNAYVEGANPLNQSLPPLVSKARNSSSVMSIKHKGGSASMHGKSSTLSQPALHPLRRNRRSGLDDSITSLGSVDVRNLAGTEHKASQATLEIMGRAKERHDAYGSI